MEGDNMKPVYKGYSTAEAPTGILDRLMLEHAGDLVLLNKPRKPK